MRFPLPRTARAVLASLLVAAVAGCGSSDDHAADGRWALTVAYPNVVTTPVLTYLAKGLGYFDQEGVDVTIRDNQGAVATILVVSGEADLYGSASASTGLSTAAMGKDTTFVVAQTGGGQAGYVVGNPSTASTLDQLAALKTCKINTFSAGSMPFAYATMLTEKLNPACEIVPYSEVPAAMAALVSGNGDAVVASYAATFKALKAQQVVPLIDTSKEAAAAEYFGPPAVEGIDWGVTKNLDRKRGAVVAYVRGLDRAKEWFDAHSDEETAGVLRTFDGFSSQDVASLAAQVAVTRHHLFLGSFAGNLDEAQWNLMLDNIAKAKLARFDRNSETVSYRARFDPSYIEQARGQ